MALKNLVHLFPFSGEKLLCLVSVTWLLGGSEATALRETQVQTTRPHPGGVAPLDPHGQGGVTPALGRDPFHLCNVTAGSSSPGRPLVYRIVPCGKETAASGSYLSVSSI